jgi:hypothetical protein
VLETCTGVHSGSGEVMSAGVEMAGGEWLVAAASRLRHDVNGALVEYPGRLATCPRGHVRALPTRFSRSEFELHCAACGRTYLFREPD